jgi:hypothetical protein
VACGRKTATGLLPGHPRLAPIIAFSRRIEAAGKPIIHGLFRTISQPSPTLRSAFKARVSDGCPMEHLLTLFVKYFSRYPNASGESQRMQPFIGNADGE